MTDRLIPTASTPDASAALGSPGDTLVNLFHVVGSGRGVTGLSWYQASDGTPVPQRLLLYDAVSGALVRNVVPGAGGTGWHDVSIATFDLEDGHQYAVGWTLLSSTTNRYFTTAPTPEDGLVLDGVRFGNDVSSAPVLPTGVGSGAVPVAVLVGNSAGSNTVAADVAAEFADWLSVSDNTHGADSAPIHVNTLASGATGFDAIKAVADAISASVGSGLNSLASTVATGVGNANSSLATLLSRWSAALASDLQTASDQVAALFNAAGSPAGTGSAGPASGVPPFPTGSWVLADERDWTAELAWAVAADLYVLSITDPTGLHPIDVAGVTWFPRAGWWAPLNGSHAQQRRFFDAEHSHLIDGGARMPGLWLRSQPTVQGHVQAWTWR